jgi:leader peptidase (prepilin peptidase) / N-methyltransferase
LGDGLVIDLAVFFFLIGACFGSFANVVIFRMPLDLSVVAPRSFCPTCKTTIPWFDNIPIVSWFVLRGRCRKCKTAFSFRYPLTEFLMASLFCAVFVQYGLSWLTLEYLIFVFGLVTASMIDFDHMILPDEFTLTGILLGLLGAAFNPEREFWPALSGVLVGGGFLWAVAAIYSALRKQEGMGGGDIKLIAWIGAVLGWTAVPFVILFASLTGTLVGLLVMLKRKSDLQTAIPFGPYLALGALAYMFGASDLAQLYVNWFIPSLVPLN